MATVGPGSPPSLSRARRVHENKNLLTAIIGYSDLLLDALPPGARSRRYAREIRAAAVRIAEGAPCCTGVPAGCWTADDNPPER